MTTLDEINEYEDSLDDEERKKIGFQGCDYGYQQMIEDMIAYLKCEQKCKAHFREGHMMHLTLLINLLEGKEESDFEEGSAAGAHVMAEDLINYLNCPKDERKGCELFNDIDCSKVQQLLELIEKEKG